MPRWKICSDVSVNQTLRDLMVVGVKGPVLAHARAFDHPTRDVHLIHLPDNPRSKTRLPLSREAMMTDTMNFETTEFGATLDPPGTIAVIGATPIGIEAALYGRFLGYDVTLLGDVDVTAFFDATKTIAGSDDPLDQPLPMLPDRCVSSLALGALEAQDGGVPLVLPLTLRQWVDGFLVPLTQTDLLRGRVHAGVTVESVTLVDAESDEEEDHGDIPPDFQLKYGGPTPPVPDLPDLFECIVVTSDVRPVTPWAPDQMVDYYFEANRTEGDTSEEILRNGYRRIAKIYASLAGREDLDLYRPLRH